MRDARGRFVHSATRRPRDEFPSRQTKSPVGQSMAGPSAADSRIHQLAWLAREIAPVLGEDPLDVALALNWALVRLGEAT